MKIFVSLFLIPPLYLFPPLWCQCCQAAFPEGTCTKYFSVSLMIFVCFIRIFACLIKIFSNNSDAYFLPYSDLRTLLPTAPTRSTWGLHWGKIGVESFRSLASSSDDASSASPLFSIVIHHLDIYHLPFSLVPVCLSSTIALLLLVPFVVDPLDFLLKRLTPSCTRMMSTDVLSIHHEIRVRIFKSW